MPVLPWLLLALCLGPHATSTPPLPSDSADVQRLAAPPRLDGRIDPGEYGGVSLALPTAAGVVQVWLGHRDGFLYVAAELPDTTYYWGDDLVVSLDVDGSGGAAPGVGDRQWYLRRMMDSSVVSVVTPASKGAWSVADATSLSLGQQRGGGDWEVASSSSAGSWWIELRIRERAVRCGERAPRLALRTFNDSPQGWWSWPTPPERMPAHRVERVPDLWVPLRFG